MDKNEVQYSIILLYYLQKNVRQKHIFKKKQNLSEETRIQFKNITLYNLYNILSCM